MGPLSAFDDDAITFASQTLPACCLSNTSPQNRKYPPLGATGALASVTNLPVNVFFFHSPSNKQEKKRTRTKIVAFVV